MEKNLNFKLTSPCSDCPFRRDCMAGWLSRRVDEIADYLALGQHTFSCHKTTGVDSPEESQCAGALHVVHKEGLNHRMIGMAAALGLYAGPEYLRNLELTFDNLAQFRAHHKNE